MRYHLIPWINLGNGAASSCVFLLAHYGAGAGIGAIVATAATWVGYELAIGRDLSFEEAFPPVRGFASEDTQKALIAGRDAIDRLQRTVRDIQGSSQAPLLAEFTKAADRVIRQLEDDPKQLPLARRFLDTYVVGVATSAEKYAKLRERSHNDEQRDAFNTLLVGAKSVAIKQEQALVADDEADLDLDIRVLQLRLTNDLK